MSEKNVAFKKVVLTIIGMIFSIGVILTIPEDSIIQMIMPFFIGGFMGHLNEKSISKLDVIFHYLTLLVFFIVWFFIVPNKLYSIFFLLGTLLSRNFQTDLDSKNSN